jgi:hypothetical protein
MPFSLADAMSLHALIQLSIGPAEVIVLVWLMLYVAAVFVCAAKGRWLLFALGIVFVIPALVGAFLAPRPNSVWARQRAAEPGE